MDPIRNGFVQWIVDFIDSLPPLLQLVVGILITLGTFKALMVIADFVQNKRERK